MVKWVVKLGCVEGKFTEANAIDFLTLHFKVSTTRVRYSGRVAYLARLVAFKKAVVSSAKHAASHHMEQYCSSTGKKCFAYPPKP